jgi:hypothetical protein
MPISTAMMPITTSSSTSVKPRFDVLGMTILVTASSVIDPASYAPNALRGRQSRVARCCSVPTNVNDKGFE